LVGFVAEKMVEVGCWAEKGPKRSEGQDKKIRYEEGEGEGKSAER